MIRFALPVAICISALILISGLKPVGNPPYETLSEYNFFEGELKLLQPKPGVVPYTVNTPLFSNYAEKLRFVSMPEGTKMMYNDTAHFEFPMGTILIKNFFYYADFRKPNQGRRLIETRLLIHEQNGWQAHAYTWNEEQTEAYYDPAGDKKQVSYIQSNGKKIATHYLIPNKNQCKGCHSKGNELVPIGTTARQLHYQDQLLTINGMGLIAGMPHGDSIPKLAIWDKPDSGDLNARARAYLDSNCGHCHSSTGPASTSGLFLTIFEKELFRLGVNKSPVAAGRGAGSLQYDIVPGKPDQSILVYRMKTNDPAIAMPEIGREQVHREAVALIEEWIRTKAYEH
jgi:uncharacterized repeat protein (TIGR03806 family)